MTDKTLGAYQRHEKHDADDFANAEFARHPDGRTAVRGHAPLGGRPWSTAGWVEYTDDQMAQDGGWSPVRECPDPEQHRDPLDFQTSFPSPAKGMRYQRERDEARAELAKADAQIEELNKEAQTYSDALSEAIARAEKAEKERDEARARINDLTSVPESRPLTPDAITDEMVERARNAPSFDGRLSPTPRIVREMLTAALTEPQRPDGAEAIEAILREEWTFSDEDGGDDAFLDLAERLARRGLRAPEDGAA